MQVRLSGLAGSLVRVSSCALFWFIFGVATVYAQPAADRVSSNQFPTSLSDAIRDYAQQQNFSGTVQARKNGQVVYQHSFGVADRAFEVPVNDETEFKIASITKAFTAVLILQLNEEGRIDLNKTIRAYLPTYGGEAGDRVTIRNLLNHTSGMQNLDAGLTSYEEALKTGIVHYQMPFTTDQLISKFCSEKLVHEPGKVFDYNNADYFILGKIVEAVSGKRFDEVLQERILQPLGMKDSGMAYQHEIIKNLASTYYTTNKGKTFVNDMPVYIENWYAAGAMYSTPSDLLRFANALFGGVLLKPATLEQMLTPGLNGYGFGVWIGFPDFGGKHYRAVNRPGGVMGANASLRHFDGVGFNESVDVVILSNTNATDLDGFSWMIGKMLLEK